MAVFVLSERGSVEFFFVSMSARHRSTVEELGGKVGVFLQNAAGEAEMQRTRVCEVAEERDEARGQVKTHSLTHTHTSFCIASCNMCDTTNGHKGQKKNQLSHFSQRSVVSEVCHSQNTHTWACDWNIYVFINLTLPSPRIKHGDRPSRLTRRCRHLRFSYRITDQSWHQMASENFRFDQLKDLFIFFRSSQIKKFLNKT